MVGHFTFESPCSGVLITVCRSIRASISSSILGITKESEQCSFFWKRLAKEIETRSVSFPMPFRFSRKYVKNGHV